MYMHSNTYICIYICICKRTYIYIYIHTCTYAHAGTGTDRQIIKTWAIMAVIAADSVPPTSNICSLACSDAEVRNNAGRGRWKRRSRRGRGRARVGSVRTSTTQNHSSTNSCHKVCIYASVYVTWPTTRRASALPLASAPPMSGLSSFIYLLFTCTACLYVRIHLSEISVQDTNMNPHLFPRLNRVDVSDST